MGAICAYVQSLPPDTTEPLTAYRGTYFQRPLLSACANQTQAACHPCSALSAKKLSLGHVDKRDSHWGFDVIQAGICYGDQLAPKPDERRRVVAV